MLIFPGVLSGPWKLLHDATAARILRTLVQLYGNLLNDSTDSTDFTNFRSF